MSGGPANSDRRHRGSPAPFENPGALGEGAAGGEDIVHEEHPATRDDGGGGKGKGAPDVLPPLVGGKGHLGRGGADAAEGIAQKGERPGAGHHLAEEDRLVEAPLPQPAAVERNRDDHLGGLLEDKGGELADGQQGEGATQMDPVAVLEAVDKLLHRAGKEERPPGSVEGGRREDAGAAAMIDPPFRPVGNATDRAEGGDNGRGAPEAGRAEMQGTGLRHRRPAEMAEGREEDVEERPEQRHLEPHILVHHEHPQVGEAGLAVDDGGYPADPVG